jgi:nitric oxide reductase subunit B
MEHESDTLSPWWRRTVCLILIFGLSILGVLAATTYQDAPPIPDKIVGPAGETLFGRSEIQSGQQVFLRYGLMENGTIWGHGAYLGPDFSAAYLHALAVDAGDLLAQRRFGKRMSELEAAQQSAVAATVIELLESNRYDPRTRTSWHKRRSVVRQRTSAGSRSPFHTNGRSTS